MPTGLSASATGVATNFSIINIVISSLAVLGILVSVVLWVVSLISVLTRKDLKESKLLWILIILITGPLGSIIYFFVENRKKLGILYLISIGIFILLLPIYALARVFLLGLR